MMYKVVNDMERIDRGDLVLERERLSQRTRGHSRKVEKSQCLRDIRKYSFPQEWQPTVWESDFFVSSYWAPFALGSYRAAIALDSYLGSYWAPIALGSYLAPVWFSIGFPIGFLWDLLLAPYPVPIGFQLGVLLGSRWAPIGFPLGLLLGSYCLGFQLCSYWVSYCVLLGSYWALIGLLMAWFPLVLLLGFLLGSYWATFWVPIRL